MANYNIEMNSLNSDGNYDVLYPRTLLNNVTNWSNNIYSKSEVNTIQSSLNGSISTLRNQISSLNRDINSLEKDVNSILQKGIIASTKISGNSANLTFPKNISDYILLFIWMVPEEGPSYDSTSWVDLKIGGTQYDANGATFSMRYNKVRGTILYSYNGTSSIFGEDSGGNFNANSVSISNNIIPFFITDKSHSSISISIDIYVIGF